MLNNQMAFWLSLAVYAQFWAVNFAELTGPCVQSKDSTQLLANLSLYFTKHVFQTTGSRT
jgi:hypothetical protein